MEFVCLAAGRGTRFGDLGLYLQKAMYPVGLRPFVEYSVRNLIASAGFHPERDRLTFVVGHHAEQVEAYFGTRYSLESAPASAARATAAAQSGAAANATPGAAPDRGTSALTQGESGHPASLRIQYVRQDRAQGTGHALHAAYEALRPDESVVAWLADLYVPASAFARIREHPSANVLTLGPDPHGENPNVAVTRRGERVVRAWRGDEPRYDIGLWKLAPAVLAGMLGREVDEFRALPSLQREIDAGRAEVGWIEEPEWLHLGGTAPTPEANVRAVVRRIFELERDAP